MVLKEVNVGVVVVAIILNTAPSSSAEEECKKREYYSTVSDSCQPCPESKYGCTTKLNSATYRNCKRCFADVSTAQPTTSQPTIITTGVRDKNHVGEEKSAGGSIGMFTVLLIVASSIVIIIAVVLLVIAKFKLWSNRLSNCRRGNVQETRVLMVQEQGDGVSTNTVRDQSPSSSNAVEGIPTSPAEEAHLFQNIAPTDDMERKCLEDSSHERQKNQI